MIRAITLLIISTIVLFCSISCKSINKPIWEGTVVIENNSSGTLFLDEFPSVKGVSPYFPKKVYYLSMAIDISSDIFHKYGVFHIPIYSGEKKEFVLTSQSSIDNYSRDLILNETTGEVLEIQTGSVCDLEFILFFTTDKYSYNNYAEYVDVIKEHGLKCYGTLEENNIIYFYIND